MRSWDVIVVGGGGAGLAAGLTLTRALRRTLVIDGAEPRNRAATHSHGVLGFDGTPPSRLLELGGAEFERFGGELRTGLVVSATRSADGFVLETDWDEPLRARQLVVAAGVTDELPPVPGLAEHWGQRVMICPYCDGWEVRGARIGILATGPKGIGQAQLLRQWSDRITFFANAAVTLAESDRREFAARGIAIEDGPVLGIDATSDGPLAVRLLGGDRQVEVIFTAPRPIPNDAILRQLGARTVVTAAGPVVAVEATGATDIAGLWAAGNVVDPSLKVSTAVGNGMATGTHVNEALVRADVTRAVEAADRSGAQA